MSSPTDFYPVGGDAANVVIQPEKLAAASIEILRRQLILTNLFDKHAEGEFRGAQNDTINIKRPSWLVGNDPKSLRKDRTDVRKDPLKTLYDTSVLNEYTIPVTIDKDLYSAMNLSDETATLDIQSMATQVIEPQTRAIAEKYEDIIAQAMRDNFVNDGKVTVDETKPDEASAAIRREILKMRKQFNDANVPQPNRHLIVGSAVESILLQDANLIRADWAGNASALRDALVGKIYGFTVVVSNSIHEYEMFGFHSSALQLVSMAPVTPQGAPYASSLGANGLALRFIKDYDFRLAEDRMLMNTYFGVGVIKDFKSAKDQAAGDLSKLAMLRGIQAVVDPQGA